MTEKNEKLLAAFTLILLILSLLPIMYLGRYNHPTGDDYRYGVDARLAWESSRNLMDVLAAAAKGIIYEYGRWQGTYSAMFLMYIPPNVFGDFPYRLVTSVILLLLTGGVFYLLKQVLCHHLNASAACFFTAASGVSLLCVETVPSQGETFFWYNGSMYYTGYFAATLFFLGRFLRYLDGRSKRPWNLPALLVAAFFLAGGNYVSLLPCLLLLCLATVWTVCRKSKKAWGTGMVTAVMFAGLLISAAAPGNRARQVDMWKIPAWKAVAKSLFQGIRYIMVWTSPLLLLLMLLLTPLLWKQLKKSRFSFRCPLVAIGLMYGLFCSMSCPTFYAMNSTGPARAVSIVYYGYILFFFSAACYLLGYVQKTWGNKIESRFSTQQAKPWLAAAIVSLFVLQALSGSARTLTTVKALHLLAGGEAKAYEAEYQQRMEILSNPAVQDVRLTPSENKPDMLYVGEFTGSDPDHPHNQSMAIYFHKNSIAVLPP